jgi:2-hydroxychromene-2-carboxylate isomerase
VTPVDQVAVFYFDLASPYAYLASRRVDALLGGDTIWQPILVGALHKHFRRVSWGATPELRASGVAEIERRAATYGLPPVRWPQPYPANTLTAMRAAVWAAEKSDTRRFAHAAYEMAFVHGIDLTPRAAVIEAANRAGMDGTELAAVLDDAELKSALRAANDAALATGVYGVPTFDAAGVLWWGDHQLEAAALYHGLHE